MIVSRKNNYIRVWIFTLLILSLSQSLQAQTKSDIFDEKTPITWMGIDFTETLYVGDLAGVGGVEMKDFFVKINNVLLEETGKYNLKKTFHKEVVNNDIKMIQKLNAAMDTNKLIKSRVYQYNRITKENVAAMISNYETGDLRGTATVMIMEDLNKKWETGTMWVVYFNAQTKEVIMAVKLTGEASGIGFRNHWSATVDDVLHQVQSKEYKRWQQLYGGKNK